MQRDNVHLPNRTYSWQILPKELGGGKRWGRSYIVEGGSRGRIWNRYFLVVLGGGKRGRRWGLKGLGDKRGRMWDRAFLVGLGGGRRGRIWDRAYLVGLGGGRRGRIWDRSSFLTILFCPPSPHHPESSVFHSLWPPLLAVPFYAISSIIQCTVL